MKLLQEYPIAVVGAGIAAKLALYRWTQTHPNQKILWILGSGHEWEPILPQSSSASVAQLEKTLNSLGYDSIDWGPDWTCREYRNKAFQPLDREVEEYWGPEQFLVERPVNGWPLETHGWLKKLSDVLRANELIDVIEGDPVASWSLTNAGVDVVLGSGTELKLAKIIYADLWSTLAETHGLPKASFAFTRQTDNLGVLQLELNHPERVGLGLDNSFCAPLTREAGEEHQRHVWGYFKNGGRSSLWTVLLNIEESEENREIAKKIRKIKQTLNKVFIGEPWVKNPKKEFCDELSGERVKFVDGGMLHFHKPLAEMPALPKTKEDSEKKIFFVTDGQGLSTVLETIGKWEEQGVFTLPFEWGAKPQDVAGQDVHA